MKITTIRRRLLGVHKAQQKLFAATVNAMQREYAKLPEAKEFLASVTAVRGLLEQQTKGAEAIFAVANQLPPGEGNRTPALLAGEDNCGPACYDHLTARRKLLEAVGNLDEWSLALGQVSDITEKAKPFQESAPKKWEAAVELGWQLSGTQQQIVSLARQVEAITATQDAILRSYGLQFWQGRKRHLRWEGDTRDCA